MTLEQQFILKVLESALQGKKCSMKPEESIDWQLFQSEIRKHDISALVYFSTDAEIHDKLPGWEKMAIRDLAINSRVTEAHIRINDLLDQNNIPYVFIKGYASAFFYPQIRYRAMGDVDFYIDEAYRKKARELLTENGYVEEMASRHHDWLYYKDGISFELHFAISGIPHGKEGEPFKKDFEDLVQKRKWISIKNDRIAVPSDFHHGLILLLHTAAHLLSGGLGLRHLCDWAAFVSHYSSNEFTQVFENEFTKLNIWRFAQVLTAVCKKHLGIMNCDWVSNVDDAVITKLTDEFLNSGEFASGQKDRQADLMTSEGFSIRIGHRSGLGNLIAVLRNSVEQHWPVTRGNIVLRFIFMVFAAIRYFVRMMSGKRDKLNLIEMSRKANQRRELFREFGLVEGLDE